MAPEDATFHFLLHSSPLARGHVDCGAGKCPSRLGRLGLRVRHLEEGAHGPPILSKWTAASTPTPIPGTSQVPQKMPRNEEELSQDPAGRKAGGDTQTSAHMAAHRQRGMPATEIHSQHPGLCPCLPWIWKLCLPPACDGSQWTCRQPGGSVGRPTGKGSTAMRRGCDEHPPFPEPRTLDSRWFFRKSHLLSQKACVCNQISVIAE